MGKQGLYGVNIYVCYCENGGRLAEGGDVITDMCVFTDKGRRNEWIRERLREAAAEEYVVDGRDAATLERGMDADDFSATLCLHEQGNYKYHYAIVARRFQEDCKGGRHG